MKLFVSLVMPVINVQLIADNVKFLAHSCTAEHMFVNISFMFVGVVGQRFVAVNNFPKCCYCGVGYKDEFIGLAVELSSAAVWLHVQGH